MSLRRFLTVAFWAAMIALPTLASLVAISCFPQDSVIPLHWNAQGGVDRWGSPWVMLPSSLIMAGSNALIAAFFKYSDKLYDHGLTHGVSREGARPLLCVTAIAMAAIWAAILIGWVAKALAYVS